MSGPIRKVLGPSRARVQGYLQTAIPQFERDDYDSDEAALEALVGIKIQA